MERVSGVEKPNNLRARPSWVLAIAALLLAACSSDAPTGLMPGGSISFLWGSGSSLCDEVALYVDTCTELDTGERSHVMSYFDDESYRHSDPNCASLVTAMDAALNSSSFGGGRGGGPNAGLALYSAGSQTIHGVRLHDEIFGTSVAYQERMRVVFHEAAHLAFFSDDETFANQAAYYCMGASNENPFGDPV